MKKVIVLLLAFFLAVPCAAAAELPLLRLDSGVLDYVAAKPGTLRAEDKTYSVTVKYRGSYSATFRGKRNYSLHLKTEDGGQMKQSLLGLREDDDYVLLGALSDPSRLRNIVGMELWRSLGYPAPAAAACELYFGDYYKGVYFLAERPDRKSAGIPREGALYRILAARADGINLFAAAEKGAPKAETWYNAGKVYPEAPSGWQPLQALLAAEDPAALMDRTAFADYYLFVNLIGATDNMKKNLYLCWNGTCFYPMPWDLDASFGRLYNADLSDPDVLYTGPVYDLLTNDAQYRTLLRERWAVLKNRLSPDAVMAVFDRWVLLLEQAGAWDREKERFPVYTDSSTGNSHPLDPEGETAVIRAYLTGRYALLDKLYGETP